jgi:hypothetical protein
LDSQSCNHKLMEVCSILTTKNNRKHPLELYISERMFWTY